MNPNPPERDAHRALRHDMVAHQLEGRDITDARVLAAMRTVPRHEFVSPPDLGVAYDDRALPIGHGQTISQPYMVALMCQLLALKPEDRVLEVGAGSGYQAAVLGQLAREVYAIELVPGLAQRATEVLSRLGYSNVHIIAGDGSRGYPQQAPYDAIIVAAAAPKLPEPLVAQLVEGGRLVAPVGDRLSQTCLWGVKQRGELQLRRSISCIFVPLLGEHGWEQSR